MAEKLTCGSCGRSFTRTSKQRPKFCSNACRQQSYRDRQKSRVLPLGDFYGQPRWTRAKGKAPLQVNGRYAKSTDPGTWSTFDVVNGASVGDGFGVMLGNGLGCYDIDHCLVDGKLEPWARLFIELIPEKVVYSEISRSGDGVHLFFLSDSEGRGSKENGVERYTMDRFIRCTFNDFIL